MLTMVTAQNIQSGILMLPLWDSSDGYVVKEITGLNPVKAELTSSSLAQTDGEQLHNKRRGPRNILMKLGLEPDYVVTSVSALRLALYDFFMTGAVVNLGFYFDDILMATIEAVVESCDNTMFSSDPEVDISLMCYDPDFLAAVPDQVTGSTVTDTTTQTITYQGTVDTGIIFSLTFPEASSEIEIYNTRPDNNVDVFTISGSFLADDKLYLNTIPRQRQLSLIRAGQVTSALTGMKRSEWTRLQKGDNLFRAHSDVAGMAFTLDYTARYGGF